MGRSTVFRATAQPHIVFYHSYLSTVDVKVAWFVLLYFDVGMVESE